MSTEIEQETDRKMNHTLEILKKELEGVRTGRASAELLSPIHVDYYGASTPLSQLATITTPESQLILVTPFDKSIVGEISKTIQNSDLGLNPSADSSVIRVPVPLLTTERRKELVKHAKKLGEDNKIALRNIRREANEHLKKLEKEKQISQDEEKMAHDKIQVLTDRHVQTIDEMVKKKETDLLTV